MFQIEVKNKINVPCGTFNKKIGGENMEEVKKEELEVEEVEEVQDTFNEDDLDILVEEGEVENVSNEN